MEKVLCNIIPWSDDAFFCSSKCEWRDWTKPVTMQLGKRYSCVILYHCLMMFWKTWRHHTITKYVSISSRLPAVTKHISHISVARGKDSCIYTKYCYCVPYCSMYENYSSPRVTYIAYCIGKHLSNNFVFQRTMTRIAGKSSLNMTCKRDMIF